MWGLSELGTATASHFGPQGLSQMIKQRFTRNDGAESPTDWKMLLSAGLKHTWWPTSQRDLTQKFFDHEGHHTSHAPSAATTSPATPSESGAEEDKSYSM